MLKTEIIENDELPYRIQIDELRGAGDSPASAVIAALSVGKKIPIGLRDKKEVARYIFWKYQTNAVWAKLIHILENDKFE